jgi:hypothetical protein
LAEVELDKLLKQACFAQRPLQRTAKPVKLTRIGVTAKTKATCSAALLMTDY